MTETVRILMVDDDWPVDDLQTVEDCKEAHLVLIEAVAKIEGQIAKAQISAKQGEHIDPIWLSRVTSALRYKKAALQAVSEKRGEFAREERNRGLRGFKEREIIKLLHKNYPNILAELLDELDKMRPEMAQIKIPKR